MTTIYLELWVDREMTRIKCMGFCKNDGRHYVKSKEFNKPSSSNKYTLNNISNDNCNSRGNKMMKAF